MNAHVAVAGNGEPYPEDYRESIVGAFATHALAARWPWAEGFRPEYRVVAGARRTGRRRRSPEGRCDENARIEEHEPAERPDHAYGAC